MSNEPNAAPEIRHNQASSRFEATVDGHESVLEYVVRGRDAIFTHTFVPPELRGRGLAARLVRAALQWASEAGLMVIPQCSYVAVFLQRHPELAE
jgi:predicted GNAT family acetyltransferase